MASVRNEDLDLDDLTLDELVDFVMSEDFDRLDELSKRTLGSYIKKATGDAMGKAYRAGDVRDKDTTKNYMKALGRQIGISKATNKLTKEAADYPHMMYHPDTGKSVKVKSPEEHNMYAKKGYTHDKPEMDEAMDPVNKKELRGTHAQRKDKDIDNDGKVDKSDEYLHNRRKAIAKAMSGKKDTIEMNPKDTDDNRGER
jgi:hypothetical protein